MKMRLLLLFVLVYDAFAQTAGNGNTDGRAEIIQKFVLSVQTVTPATSTSPARAVFQFKTWVVKPWRLTNTTRNSGRLQVSGGPATLRMTRLRLFEPNHVAEHTECGTTVANPQHPSNKHRRFCMQTWTLSFTIRNRRQGMTHEPCTLNGQYRVQFGSFTHGNNRDGDDIDFRFNVKAPPLCPQKIGDISISSKKLAPFRDPEFKMLVPMYMTWEIAYFQAKINSKQLIHAQLNSTKISEVYIQHKDTKQANQLTQVYGDGNCMAFGCETDLQILRPKGQDQAGFRITLDPNYISSSIAGELTKVQVHVVMTYVVRNQPLQRRLLVQALPVYSKGGAVKMLEYRDQVSRRIVVRDPTGFHMILPAIGEVTIDSKTTQRALVPVVIILLFGIACLFSQLSEVDGKKL